MVAIFPCGKVTIVAGTAVIHDTCMIERCGYKASGYVAHMAIFIGWHMVRWRCFAAGGCAIVARRTVIKNAGVIEPGAGKCHAWHMAGIAVLTKRINVRQTDLGICTGCMNTIVTGITSRSHD